MAAPRELRASGLPVPKGHVGGPATRPRAVSPVLPPVPPHGEAGLGPGFNSNPAPMAAFRLQVRSGLGAMPAFPDALIGERELDQLLAFVDYQREQAD